MRFNVFKNTVLLFVFILISCGSQTKTQDTYSSNENQTQETTALKETLLKKEIVVGANRIDLYLPLLKGKRIGIVANQTSVIFKNTGFTHLVDSLVSLKMNVSKVFAPEHGFRGTADAGEIVKDGIDIKTGLPIVSLYGKNKKPSTKQLQDLDIIVFDIQDVGARFYTYISSLHYVMEACAESKIPVIVLDRPNPNGHYIDGPILEPIHKSFVGMHPIPIVHGMTIGEYAKMINGETWLANAITCDLTIIPLKNYTHATRYNLPIKPSPNLPNDRAINLYPSLCFFEGTNVSAGRGTEKQFQIYGSPFLPKSTFQFIPKPNEGSKYPKHEGKICYGKDLTHAESLSFLDLNYLINAYKATADQTTFFSDFFTKLAGTKTLQKQIEKGLSMKQIKASWATDLEAYKTMRKAYLIYE